MLTTSRRTPFDWQMSVMYWSWFLKIGKLRHDHLGDVVHLQKRLQVRKLAQRAILAVRPARDAVADQADRLDPNLFLMREVKAHLGHLLGRAHNQRPLHPRAAERILRDHRRQAPVGQQEQQIAQGKETHHEPRPQQRRLRGEEINEEQRHDVPDLPERLPVNGRDVLAQQARQGVRAQRRCGQKADQRKCIGDRVDPIALERERRVVKIKGRHQRPVKDTDQQALYEYNEVVQTGCALANHSSERITIAALTHPPCLPDGTFRLLS